MFQRKKPKKPKKINMEFKIISDAITCNSTLTEALKYIGFYGNIKIHVNDDSEPTKIVYEYTEKIRKDGRSNIYSKSKK